MHEAFRDCFKIITFGLTWTPSTPMPPNVTPWTKYWAKTIEKNASNSSFCKLFPDFVVIKTNFVVVKDENKMCQRAFSKALIREVKSEIDRLIYMTLIHQDIEGSKCNLKELGAGTLCRHSTFQISMESCRFTFMDVIDFELLLRDLHSVF